MSERKKARVAFIDQARTVAIMLMLIGHSLDRFLGEPWRSGEAYQDYQYVRGISSTLFLMVSGFSFVIASFGRWNEFMYLSERMKARIRRIALILFLGYIMHLWAPTLRLSIARFDPEKWEGFLRFDVLQNIGIGIIGLHLIARLAGRPERFWKLSLFAMAAVIAVAPLTYRPDMDARLPIELASMVNMHHRSIFPVVPYTAYLLLGALFGHCYYTARKDGKENRVFLLGAVLAVGLIAFELLIRGWAPAEIFPYSATVPKTPGNTFARAGWSILIIGGLYFLGQVRVIWPRLSFVLSRDTLAIYFVHLILVYGGKTYPSMFPSYARAMSPGQITLWIVGLIGAMVAMAYGIGWMRDNLPDLLTMGRRTLIVGGLIAFCLWPVSSVVGVSISFAAGAALVFGADQYKRRLVRDRVSGQLVP